MNYIAETINNGYEHISDYMSQLPANTGKQMLFGFGLTFVIDAIITTNPKRAAYLGACAALATFIHALLSPIFKKYITDGRTQLTWCEEMCRTVFTLAGVSCLAAAFGHRAALADLALHSLIYGIRNLVAENRDLNRANWFICTVNEYSLPSWAK